MRKKKQFSFFWSRKKETIYRSHFILNLCFSIHISTRSHPIFGKRTDIRTQQEPMAQWGNITLAPSKVALLVGWFAVSWLIYFLGLLGKKVCIATQFHQTLWVHLTPGPSETMTLGLKKFLNVTDS